MLFLIELIEKLTIITIILSSSSSSYDLFMSHLCWNYTMNWISYLVIAFQPEMSKSYVLCKYSHFQFSFIILTLYSLSTLFLLSPLYIFKTMHKTINLFVNFLLNFKNGVVNCFPSLCLSLFFSLFLSHVRICVHNQHL